MTSGATEHIRKTLEYSGAAEHFGIGATEHVPIVQAAYADRKWRSLPQELSAILYEKYVHNQDADYTWDRGKNGRPGTWAPEGELSSIKRYKIDFVNRLQFNLDTDSMRSIRVVWVHPQDVEARFGE